MTVTAIRRCGPAWEAAFLAAVRRGANVNDAAAEAGICRTTPYTCRGRNPRFAKAWADAEAASPGQPNTKRKKRHNVNWKDDFLEALAETSNVSAAAAFAGIQPRFAYGLRRTDAGFAAQWFDGPFASVLC